MCEEKKDYENRIEEFQIETLENLKKRVYSFLDDIILKYKNCNNILIVTHACITSMIEQYFLKTKSTNEILKNGQYKKYCIK